MGVLDQYGRPMLAPVKRGYAAAKKLARYGDITASRGSADYELREGLGEVRSKARFLARNSASMRRYMQLMEVNVVGDAGFRFNSRVAKMDGSTLNIALNQSVETAWEDWCEQPTVCGTMHMCDLQAQAVNTWCRDGEVIWEVVTGDKYRGGIAVNPLEADYLDETLNSKHPPTGNEIRMGVEITNDGKPVAYHFLTIHPGDLTWWSYMTNKRYRRVPADRVLHLFKKTRPGQTRGEPPAAAMILSIQMLDGYREAETMGRRLRSALMGFFTKMEPTQAGISDLADHEDEADEVLEMDMEPGRMKELPRGVDFKEFSPGGSQTDYADFESQVKKDIAMGIGISTMSHGMEVEGISYSSGRTVAIEDRDFYKTIQNFMIRGLMIPLWRKWVDAANVYMDDVFQPSQADKVRQRGMFRGRGWDWVDPAKDVKANAEALSTGQTSYSRIAAQRGLTADELFIEIKEDIERLKALGLQHPLYADITETNSGASDADASDDT